MILTVVFYFFVVFTVIQTTYHLIFFSFLFKKKNSNKTIEKVPISVIVYSKNNGFKLQENLPFLLAQKYPIFEIVVISNACSDTTIEILDAFEKEHKNIKIIAVQNNEAFWNNKKYALTLGIKAAKYNHLLFTDANSQPISENWITEMSNHFTFKKTIVLAYGKIKKEKTLTNLIIRFNNLLKAIKCFTFAKLGSPFMAFSNNSAYTKTEFFKVNGFINHIKLKDGLEDLFIKDAATSENITFSVSKDSFIETDAPKSFSKWFQEERITNNIKEHYKFKHRFLLNIFIISKVFFYVLAIVLFFFYPWKIILPLVLVYFLIQYLIIGLSAKKLKEPQLIFFLPFLEIVLLLLQISIFSVNLISKPKHWK